ncbi:MAG: peptidoglycan-binding domain-containing protein [Candidatus Paceibacterota bacterium]
MFKKFVFSLFLVGMLVGPLTTNASTFTSLKAQLEYISNQIANFSSDVRGEVLGATSSATVAFTPTPSSIPYNGSVTLTWTSTNAARCAAGGYGTPVGYPEGEAWMTPYEKGTSGSQTISNLKVSTRFYIWCFDYTGEGVQAEAIVNVETRIPTVELTADPIVVNYGGSTKLSWTTRNTTYPCIASGGWSGNQANGGSVVINNITQTTVFTLTCTGYLPVMSATSSVTVHVKDTANWCYYPTPKKDCSYIKGPNYNPATNCGMILDCKLNDKIVVESSKPTTTGTNSVLPSSYKVENFCSFTFAKNLAYGNVDTKTSKDVSYLQSVLVDEKLLPSSAATGKFYAQTRTALANFQKRYKLAQTGKVDANTRIKLNSLFQTYCQNN